MIQTILNIIKPLIEIGILWVIMYFLLVFIKDTRAIQVLKGVFVLIVLFVVTQKLGFETISWALTKLFAISVIGFLILFQPELRRGFARIGQHYLFRGFTRGKEEAINEVCEAVDTLAQKKIGAIIALEREVGLKNYVETGVRLDSEVSREVLTTLFMPNTPLHDGGVIIEEERVAAAGCIFPLTQNPNMSPTMGTRHRAAIGLSEETDAVVVLVSEAVGTIAVGIGGRLTRNLTKEKLKEVLIGLCGPKRRPKQRGKKILQKT